MKPNENTLAEQPVIGWLKELGYETLFSAELAPGGAFMERNDYREAVLEPRLKRSIKRINPQLPDEVINQVARQVAGYRHEDLVLGNKEMHEWLTRGIRVEVKDGGNSQTKICRLIDFDQPDNNEFLAVNQFTVQGKSPRIPDLVVFINGLPLAIFELKSPIRENATIADAYAQIHDTYHEDIPRLFYYNQIEVISDLNRARHGTISGSYDLFTAWKGLDSETEDHPGRAELEILTKGMFVKTRILDLIRYFTVFEADAEENAAKYFKKMAMYHQYFGVNRAVESTLKAVGKSKKIGVFWHTQGSGKSLSMVFYVNKVSQLEQLSGPTILFLTDRNDLDSQLYRTFLRTGYPAAKQAESIGGLAEKLSAAGAEILFTTIQKFDLNEVLSERDNIIVIADEAHRSQYAALAGNVRSVLPNASFMGITGTPIELSNRNTRIVFGEHISQYPIDRSVRDKTTVPIFYEGRLIPLHLLNEYIDEDFDRLTAEQPEDSKEAYKHRLMRRQLLAAVGADSRLKQLAEDIVFHFNHRQVEGKAMIVTMSRQIAVKVYQILSALKGAPEAAVIISGNEDFSGQIQTEVDNRELEKRFKNPDDPLKIAIVCDMWLTGFDLPCLQTMYLDKPLKGHSLMQAIARVNRRYKDKSGGVVIDYIGIAENLKKALAIYASDIQKQALLPLEEIIRLMRETYAKVREFFRGLDYLNWKKLEPAKQAQLFPQAVNQVLEDKNGYLRLAGKLFKLFSLAMPHAEAFKLRDEIEFFETVRKMIIKNTIVEPIYINKKTETALRELIDNNIVSEGIIDIFARSGQDKPNISILDEKFLAAAKKSRLKNLTVETIRKLIEDDLRIRGRKNIFRYRTLSESLQETIEQYENNIISSTKLIEHLVELAKDIKTAQKYGEATGLSADELAFYDAVSYGRKTFSRDLKPLVKELVAAVKRDLSVDWTNQENIKARIRADVKLILLRNNFDFAEAEKITDNVFVQAVNLWQDFSPAQVLYLEDSEE